MIHRFRYRGTDNRQQITTVRINANIPARINQSFKAMIINSFNMRVPFKLRQ